MEVALFPSGEAKTLERSVKRRKSSGGLRGRIRGEGGGKTRVAVCILIIARVHDGE